MSDEKPAHRHDCDRCKFIGNLEYEATGEDGAIVPGIGDVYVCPSDRHDPTILLRYSDDPPDYSSFELFPDARDHLENRSTSPLSRAYKFAKEKGAV